MKQRTRKTKRFRSFALSRDRVRSIEGAGVVRDTCNWLFEGNKKKEEAKEGRHEEEDDNDDDDDEEEEEEKDEGYLVKSR